MRAEPINFYFILTATDDSPSRHWHAVFAYLKEYIVAGESGHAVSKEQLGFDLAKLLESHKQIMMTLK